MITTRCDTLLKEIIQLTMVSYSSIDRVLMCSGRRKGEFLDNHENAFPPLLMWCWSSKVSLEYHNFSCKIICFFFYILIKTIVLRPLVLLFIRGVVIVELMGLVGMSPVGEKHSWSEFCTYGNSSFKRIVVVLCK